MKKVLIIIGVLILTMVIGLFTAAEIFEEKIGQQVEDSINLSLKTEFNFEAFDLSLVRSFPSAAIRFQNISLLDLQGDTLLMAEKAKIKLKLFSLLKSKIEFVSTEISDGRLNILVDSKGRRNYEIWQKEVDNSEESELVIEEAKIKNVEISYINKPNDSDVSMIAKDLMVSINAGEVVKIETLGSLFSKNISVGKNDYLVNKSLSINSGIEYDISDQVLLFQDGEVGVEGIVFYSDGTIDFNGDHEIYDLVLTNTNGSLEAIFGLLPKNQAESFKKITSSGDFDLTVFYKGKQGKYSSPTLQADLRFDRGRIVVPQIDIPIKAVSFAAKFIDNKKKGLNDAQIQINAFKGTLDGERITGNFAYENFSAPYIKLDAKGKMPIETLLKIVKINSSTTEGNIDFNELVINGKLRDLSTPIHQANTISKADVVIDNITFDIHDHTILVRDGKLKGQADYFELQGLEVRTPQSTFILDGYLKRLVPFLFAEFQRPDLQFDLDVKSPTCDIAEILNIMSGYGSSVDANATKVASTTGPEYVAFMNGDIDISIDKFEHNEIKGSDFEGHLSFINNNVGIKGTSKGMKGQFDVEGILNRSKAGSNLQAKLICNNVDVRTFFKQTKDFGQQTLKAEHLEGNLNSQLLINADWNSKGDFNRKGLEVLGSAKILDGELIKFDMMDNFSKYINSEDLKHIRFGSLDNYFEIRNEVIYIPAMFIQSNAANITLSGEHGFNNLIDYNIKVNAGQVLTKKLKRHNPKLSPIPARKKGFFNLYYSVDGSVDDPAYRTAKRQVKSDFVQSEYRKEIIRKKLQQAFPSKPDLLINTAPAETQDQNLKFEDSSEDYLDPIEGKNN